MNDGDSQPHSNKKQKTTEQFDVDSQSKSNITSDEWDDIVKEMEQNFPDDADNDFQDKEISSQVSMTSISSQLSQSPDELFITLSNVLLSEGNLLDLNTTKNTYVLYRLPWTDNGQVPNSVSQPSNSAYRYVQLPHQGDTIINFNEVNINKWQLILRLLSGGTGKLDNMFKLEKAIKSYNPILATCQFDILRSYINQRLNENERKDFFDHLLPAIIQLALDLPNAITCNLPLLQQGSSTTLFLSQYQISSLLANAFLCTFNSRLKDDTRCINFSL